LSCGAGGLELDGHSVAELAAAHGTPLYAYALAEVRRATFGLRRALAATGLPARIYYALKANRFAPVVATLHAEGDIGIDACSPREVDLALESGFAPGDISVTASMPSNRDLESFVARGAHVNLDSLSSLTRYGERAPRGSRIGLRVDPGVAAGWGLDPKLSYANSKFGLTPAAAAAAIERAHGWGLVVDTLHMHLGWGLQESALEAFRQALTMLAALARATPTVDTINVGGGLGARRREEDRPLPLDAWTGAIAEVLGPLGCEVACEPGTLLVDSAGILVVEVTTVEEKAGVVWVGVDAGHNVNVYAAHYGLPIEVVHVARPCAPAEACYRVAGNINESNDVFAREVALPCVREGDLLALLPAGAYGASMSSDHCLRGDVKEVAV
jgi:diaminopimelate decarboxylase